MNNVKKFILFSLLFLSITSFAFAGNVEYQKYMLDEGLVNLSDYALSSLYVPITGGTFTGAVEIDGDIKVDGGTFTVGTPPIAAGVGYLMGTGYSSIDFKTNQTGLATIIQIKGEGNSAPGAFCVYSEDDTWCLNHEIWDPIAYIYTWGPTQHHLAIQSEPGWTGGTSNILSGDATFFQGSLDGYNQQLGIWGYPTGGALAGGTFQVADTTSDFHISTTNDLILVPAGGEVKVEGDLDIVDATPHVQWIPSAGDAFEIYGNASELYCTNTTDGNVIWRARNDNLFTLYSKGIAFGDVTPVDNYIFKYDAALGYFNLEADAGEAGGDSISIDSVAVVDPDFVSTGDIDFVDTSNTVTANIRGNTVQLAELDVSDVSDDIAGDIAEGELADSIIVSADIKDGEITVADTAITAGRSLTWSTNDLVADAELYTDTKGIYFEDPTADDDFNSIWKNGSAGDYTITEMWGESDQTVVFNLQIDDGSPADVNSSDLTAAAGEVEDTSLDGDTTLAAGEELDLKITSVSGTPTWVSIMWTFTKDD